MNKLLCLMAVLCVYVSAAGQVIKKINPLYIDDSLPNIYLGKVINYKDSIAKFYDFKKKLIILDFWNIHCTTCIAQFPKEIALQKQFDKDIQIVLVTSDSVNRTKEFIKNWEYSNQMQLNLPVIVEDTIFHRYIRGWYQPNYAWFDYEPHLIAQTNEYFLSIENIENVLKEIDILKVMLSQYK